MRDVTGQVDFNSHTDRVVAAAVRLVNVLTPGELRGRPYRPPGPDDPAALVTAALDSATPLSGADIAELTGIAARLRGAFEAVASGDVDAAAGVVNALLEQTQARPRLSHHDGEPWHLHFHGPDESAAASWGASCATGVAIVLGGEFHDRLGVCTAPRCDRVYVDTSRNGTRRYCSTACQNRVKTAAFRARTTAE